MTKSTVDQIRARFDADVERFSNFETGQSATIDAPLTMALVSQASAAVTPSARHLVDIGCGAGNYSLAVLQRLPDLEVTLVDLSQPMLARAAERVGAATRGTVRTVQADVRDLALGTADADLIVAAAVLHHLRGEDEWRAVFGRCFGALRLGGSMWISDLVTHDHPAVQAMMWTRYGEYLSQLRDDAYRDHVFAYVEQEDSPRSLTFQLDLMRSVGFRDVEVLHKTGCFAAFGGLKRAKRLD